MAYDLKGFDADIQGASEWLKGEFSSIRTGRATPALLDSIEVEAYGARLPLVQVGSVGTEDARTLRVVPWDKNQIKDIERAIHDANLGLSVVVDEKGIRVIFPELTSDRRVQLLKLAKMKLEDARVRLRKSRDDVMKDIDRKSKDSTMSEDDAFRTKGEVEKRVVAGNKLFDEMYARKEAEIEQ